MKVSPQVDREAGPEIGEDIHPTAIVHPETVIGSGVSIGAYSVIGAGVTIGDNTDIMNHVAIHGTTRIGTGNKFYPFCAVGMDPQDKKYEFQGRSELEIGDGNVFRESVTLHRGTPNAGGITRIGNGNWILAYCHIAHDCQVGDFTLFANAATLGGCVSVGDRTYLGGFTAVHPFCSVGEVAITGGHTMIAQDVPPYVNATGNRAKLFGVNKVGMERAGYSKKEVSDMKAAYKIFFRKKLPAEEALVRLAAEFSDSEPVRRFIDFIKQSKRGICR